MVQLVPVVKLAQLVNLVPLVLLVSQETLAGLERWAKRVNLVLLVPRAKQAFQVNQECQDFLEKEDCLDYRECLA